MAPYTPQIIYRECAMKSLALTFVLTTLVLSLWSSPATAQSTDTRSQSSQSAAPDNTKSNADSDNRTPSADQQPNNKSDMDIAQSIRSSVMRDKTLSTDAHNAKIVAVNGTVTLNGVVDSAAERSTVEQLAAQVVGPGRVVNKLKVNGQ